jgi:hypothetical protein
VTCNQPLQKRGMEYGSIERDIHVDASPRWTSESSAARRLREWWPDEADLEPVPGAVDELVRGDRTTVEGHVQPITVVDTDHAGMAHGRAILQLVTICTLRVLNMSRWWHRVSTAGHSVAPGRRHRHQRCRRELRSRPEILDRDGPGRADVRLSHCEAQS